MKYLYSAGLLLATLAAPVLASAAPFQPNNIVVARVGDGSAALTTAATAVFLDEYTPAGRLVQSVALPTSITGNNFPLTANGTLTSELILTRSADGRYLVLTGYGTAPGTTVFNSAATDVARVIALIGADGSIDTSTSPGADAFDGASIRAAVTADGSSFYSVGSASGVRYQAFGTDTSTPLAPAPASVRAIGIGANNNLYLATTTSPYLGLSQVGTGLPTAASTVAVLPGFAGATDSSPNSFYFADLSADVPGVDVVYVADDRTTAGGGIQKWSLVNGSWVLSGTIAGSASTAVRGLGGRTVGTTVTLAATSAGGLFVLTDATGYNVAPSVVALPTAVATPGTNKAFRGAAMAPVVLAPTITSFTPATGAVGTTVTITGTNFTGATAVSIGGQAISGYTVVSATSITLVVPASVAASGPLTVVTPGGTATSTTSFSLALAAAASQALPGLALYPNPATDYVQVSLPQPGAATVALRDLTGRQVLAPQALPASQRLRLPASLAAGIYLLEVRQGSETAVRRIEKK
ncbi:T9SS type A sorting domain-containing protein [Hymenobacter sp. RP-2-7]|uniref:T9SS type A sorting domain-containing protein n=1 Tax=Hymenobacter polaris TaxID=2682546 RepID=A0A7Y0AEI8_9BACT|nr:IPT/TIG domain-containing protein [Hymenobacter polaris]NML65890.1 T9SS type A sorting domain-containing protein [Hymenobacter polaris]